MPAEEPNEEETDESEDGGPIEGSPVRPPMTGHRVLEMDFIGWVIFIALLLVLLPLLPVLLVILVLMQLFGGDRERLISWGTHSRT